MNPLLQRLRQEAARFGVAREFDAIVAQYPAEAGVEAHRATFRIEASWDHPVSANDVAAAMTQVAADNGYHFEVTVL